jgi:hypothetical protein
MILIVKPLGLKGEYLDKKKVVQGCEKEIKISLQK